MKNGKDTQNFIDDFSMIQNYLVMNNWLQNKYGEILPVAVDLGGDSANRADKHAYYLLLRQMEIQILHEMNEKNLNPIEIRLNYVFRKKSN